MKGRVIVPWDDILEGQVIKYEGKVSFLGDIDPETGKPIETLDTKRRSISKKILVFPGSKGSTVGSAVLYGLAKRNKSPKLLMTPNPDLVTMGGAIFGEIPAIEISKEAFNHLRDGDRLKVRIVGENGEITFLNDEEKLSKEAESVKKDVPEGN